MNHDDKERLIIEWRIAMTLRLISDHTAHEVIQTINDLEPEIIKSVTDVTKGE